MEGYLNYSAKDIATRLGTTVLEVRAILLRFENWMKKPDIVDSEAALIKGYIKAYQEGGEEAGRKEVTRLLSLGKEIRLLREMVLENGNLALPEAPSQSHILHFPKGRRLF